MLNALHHKILDWVQEHEAARRLRGLDDRLLADIGTQRGDIRCFVQGCTEQPSSQQPGSSEMTGPLSLTEALRIGSSLLPR